MHNSKKQMAIGTLSLMAVFALSACASVDGYSTNTMAADTGVQSKTMTADTDAKSTEMAALKAECMAMHETMKAKMAAKKASGEMGMHGKGMMSPEHKDKMAAKHAKHLQCMEVMPEMKAKMHEQCKQKHGQCPMMKDGAETTETETQ